ncbi:MAG: alkaline phosphatase family protein [Chloroflexi bacterium]|nr:alkaline phosphatase family protein [Chloroflexota bacterium]MCL5076181.1 alkaline phosphatase family protein [Chloroflexota bacterium]
MQRAKGKKVIFIGIDGLMPEMVERFAQEGSIPAMARLMGEGVFSPMYSSPPVDTPTNWTSLATGAWTGTHGINSFGLHLSGEPFGRIHMLEENIFPRFPGIAEDDISELCRAEYIWQAAERAGKRCILVNYPGGWPPSIKEGIVVDGSGPYSSVLSRLSHANRYIAGGDNDPASISLSSASVGMAGNLRGPIPLTFAPAAGWRNLPSSNPPPLEGELVLPRSVGFRMAGGRWVVGDSSETLSYHLLLLGSAADGYDQLLVSKERDAGRAPCVLRVGEWSPWLSEEFQSPYGPVRGKFKLYLEELSSDGRRVNLERTVIFNSQGWAYPQEVADELIEALLPLEREEQLTGEEELTQAVPVVCPVFEPTSVPHQAIGIAAMTRYLAEKYPWDLLFVQIHAPDRLNHDILNGLCPDWVLYDASKEEECWERFRQEYRVLDMMVGDIVDHCADENTVVVVVSDHGGIPCTKMVWLGQALMRAGLLTYRKDPQTGYLVIDWAKTKVVLGDHPLAQNIWVNLKGRDPYGIVEPGEEYERVCSEVIKTLYAVKDPETDECPIALCLRREEAGILGQWGDRVGDIIYYFRPGYTNKLAIISTGPVDPALIPVSGFETVTGGIKTTSSRGVPIQGIHVSYLPGAKHCGCSVQGTMIIAGPGIRKGARCAVPPWTVDIVPMLAHLLGFQPPRQSEGKVLSSILVD